MLFVLSIVSLFVATSWSQPIGVTSFYRDSSCTTSPYQLEITYGNLCVYGRANYTSTKITPEFYANVFPVNNTVEIYEYASGTYPTATCIGSYKSSIQKIPTACTLETDPMTGQSYYRSIQLLLSDPGIAVLTNNRPYALVR